ncbi:hypothetical protein J6590_023973 [Homalodisca vitripennis]|nr:hypothetical protein J6590_023973 [Homalodisca vitripennis]
MRIFRTGLLSSTRLDTTTSAGKLHSSNRLHTTKSAGKLFYSNRLHTTTSSGKLSVPCRVGCISRPPAGHAQKRVFVSLSADAAAATSELRLLHCPE